jgi:diaminopimelate decarboxylase
VNAHPAGPRHAEEIYRAGVPPRPQTAQDLLRLAPNVWPRNVFRGDDGVVSVAGVAVTELAEVYGTP